MNIEPLVIQLFKNIDEQIEAYKKTKKGVISEILVKLGITSLIPVNSLGQQKSVYGLVQELKPFPKGFVIIKQGPKACYAGYWSDINKQGQGYMLFENGLMYKGEYKDD